MDPLCHILTIPMVDIPKICCLVDKEKEGRPCDCVLSARSSHMWEHVCA